LPFDDRLELGLASIDDMPEEQTSLLDETVVATETAAKGEPTIEPAVTLKEVRIDEVAAIKKEVTEKTAQIDDAPMCFNCGNQTQRAGSCYVCTSCGSTTGCS
jgi:ribonucleoside-diphosphate reductase alpha chain